MSAAKQTLIDQETLDYLGVQREDDYRIVREIGLEQKNIEFKYGHAERFNNWKTDEMYIDRAFIAEEAFMDKIYDEEKAALLSRHVRYLEKKNSILNFFKKKPIFSMRKPLHKLQLKKIRKPSVISSVRWKT